MCTHSVHNYSLQTQGLPYNLELILLNCSSVLNNKLREIDIWSGKIFWFLYRLEIPAWSQQLKWLGMNENRTTFISVCSKNQYLCKFCKWAQKVWRELGQLIIYKQNIFLYKKNHLFCEFYFNTQHLRTGNWIFFKVLYSKHHITST